MLPGVVVLKFLDSCRASAALPLRSDAAWRGYCLFSCRKLAVAAVIAGMITLTALDEEPPSTFLGRYLNLNPSCNQSSNWITWWRE